MCQGDMTRWQVIAAVTVPLLGTEGMASASQWLHWWEKGRHGALPPGCCACGMHATEQMLHRCMSFYR